MFKNTTDENKAKLLLGKQTALGPEIIKLFSCSTQLSMKFFLLINVEMPAIVGISTFTGRKNSNLGLSEPKKKNFLMNFSTELSMKKVL